MEKLLIVVSVFVELPTAMAPGTQAGAPIEPLNELLPLEITVAMPAVLSCAMTGRLTSLKHGKAKEPPPRLMLIASMLSMLLRRKKTRCNARIWSDVKVRGHGAGLGLQLVALLKRLNTWMAMIRAWNAVPRFAGKRPAAIEATCVP